MQLLFEKNLSSRCEIRDDFHYERMPPPNWHLLDEWKILILHSMKNALHILQYMYAKDTSQATVIPEQQKKIKPKALACRQSVIKKF